MIYKSFWRGVNTNATMKSNYWTNLYFRNGTPFYALVTIAFVIAPFIVSYLVEHLLMFCLNRKKENIQSLRWLNKIPKCLRHFPLFQPIISFGFLSLLLTINKNIEAKVKEYGVAKKNLLASHGNDKQIQAQINQIAKDIAQEKENYAQIFCQFQEMKLFEAFAENAPQFVLQIAIALETGKKKKITE